MDYVVQCRLSPTISESFAPLPVADWPLFLFHFAADDGPGVKDAEPLFRAAVRELLDEESTETLSVDYESVEVREGSVTLIIFVTAVTAFPPAAVPAGGVGAGVMLLWAGDKLLGGALSEFGKKLTQKTIGKFFGQDRQPPVPPRDLEDVARRLALEAATERGCRLAIVSGAFPVDSKYGWTYEFVGCDTKQRVTVIVDPFGKEPSQTVVQ